MPVLIFIIVVAFIPTPAGAQLVGNVYYFTGTFLEQTYQQDTAPTFKSLVTGEFSITVLDVTTAGGDDVIRYHYRGFNAQGVPVPEDYNGTSRFQSNKVYWSLTTLDPDHDNRSSATSLRVYPESVPRYPGRSFFVNPSWATHDDDWSNAVNETVHNPMVHDTAFSADEGTFAFRFIVDVEDPPTNATGTLEYSFSASYDEDGVLSTYELTATARLYRADLTIYYVRSTKFTRTSGTSALGGSLLTTLTPALIALPVGIVLGLAVGKKVWD